MRVALIYPEVYDLARFRDRRKEFPPFGILYLGAVLEQAGNEVAIYKVNPGTPTLNLTEYDAVGFSIASSATYNALKTCRETSRFKSGALVMVGGVHANFFPEMTLTDFDADVVCCDEGEAAILEILAREADRDFSRILGIAYRGPMGVIRTLPRQKSKQIDWLPLPAPSSASRSGFPDVRSARIN
jgi:anaerobic magnesium-protoporphyrin IX monomethyl ester cyclase